MQELFSRFKSGDTSLEEKPGRGRPSDFDDKPNLATVEGDESLTTRRLADNFNVGHSTILRRLKNLGKIWKLAEWVPYEFSDNNKAERVQICTDLLQRNERGLFLKDTITADESWLLFRNLKRKKVCVSPGISPKGIMKDMHCKKAMRRVWWARSGITHWEILFNGICY
ncbi:histone-lysine N-methyltransferase SETMAR-like [Argiope bruennichi]|uniref:histone-lysine N-methyltransferase SETMAR-like n=1 Tax=Argiope bruennichi TaxID=94029 RepID=UPI00249538C3|nr:histone-lysine N-methyltransferase SETMAR-like [Argiope bruennichi]